MALTFDDGPSPYTRAVVEVLRRERARATFFAVGQQLPPFAGELRAVTRAGFPVADHSQSHPLMAGLPAREQYRQIVDAERAIRGAGARFARLFRTPGGNFDETTLRLLREKRMPLVLWTVDSIDYRQPGVDAIVETVLRGAVPGAIILMHDGGGDRTQTVQALPRILAGLRERRLRPVTVERLLLDARPPRRQRVPPGVDGP